MYVSAFCRLLSQGVFRVKSASVSNVPVRTRQNVAFPPSSKIEIFRRVGKGALRRSREPINDIVSERGGDAAARALFRRGPRCDKPRRAARRSRDRTQGRALPCAESGDVLRSPESCVRISNSARRADALARHASLARTPLRAMLCTRAIYKTGRWAYSLLCDTRRPIHPPRDSLVAGTEKSRRVSDSSSRYNYITSNSAKQCTFLFVGFVPSRDLFAYQPLDKRRSRFRLLRHEFDNIAVSSGVELCRYEGALLIIGGLRLR